MLRLRIVPDDGADRSVQALAVAANEQFEECRSSSEDMRHELLIRQCIPILDNRPADDVHDSLTVRVARSTRVTGALMSPRECSDPSGSFAGSSRNESVERASAGLLIHTPQALRLSQSDAQSGHLRVLCQNQSSCELSRHLAWGSVVRSPCDGKIGRL